MATPHSTWTTENIRGTQQKAEHSTAPVVSVQTHTCSATWHTTAHTEPPYDDTISTKDTRVLEARPMTGPMISYCPPWPPPHRKCWYSTNVDMNLRRSQPPSYMNNKYSQQHTTQYGVDLPTSTTADNSYTAPPAPTASEKNLLRPP